MSTLASHRMRLKNAFTEIAKGLMHADWEGMKRRIEYKDAKLHLRKAEAAYKGSNLSTAMTWASQAAEELLSMGGDTSANKGAVALNELSMIKDSDWARIGRKKNPGAEDHFGPPISSYSRKQALEDGVLVDMTEWGSASKGFHGGFTSPVAFTSALWDAVDHKPMPSMQDVRGRAHDVLWMASLAVRAGMKRGMIHNDRRGGRVGFYVLMQVGRKRKHFLNVDLSPGDEGEPVVTIGFASDF